MAEATRSTSGRRLRWSTAGRTDVGCVRDQNEDAFLLAPELGLACVCDGMGGHASGEVASQLAIEAVRDFLASDAESVAPAERLAEAIRKASARIRAAAEGEPGLRGMGTTIVAALLRDDRLVVAHAGDSRAYRYRGGELVLLTRDHSLLEEFIAIRKPSAAEIALFPHKNVITRALGIEAEVAPELHEEPALPGDRFLLCTDGLTNMLGPDRIAALLAAELSPERACERLVEAANEAGGADNVTAVILAAEAPAS